MVPTAELQDSLDTDTQSLQLLPDDFLRHFSAKILNRQTTKQSSGRDKVWKLTPLLSSTGFVIIWIPLYAEDWVMKNCKFYVKAIFVHCIKSRHLFIAWPLAKTAACMTVSSLTKCYTILANKSHVGKHTRCS